MSYKDYYDVCRQFYGGQPLQIQAKVNKEWKEAQQLFKGKPKADFHKYVSALIAEHREKLRQFKGRNTLSFAKVSLSTDKTLKCKS